MLGFGAFLGAFQAVEKVSTAFIMSKQCNTTALISGKEGA